MIPLKDAASVIPKNKQTTKQKKKFVLYIYKKMRENFSVLRFSCMSPLELRVMCWEGNFMDLFHLNVVVQINCAFDLSELRNLHLAARRNIQ